MVSGPEVQHPVMKGVRLGRRERYVLLNAAPVGEDWWRVRALEDGRAAHEATLRAVRKLWALELVDVNKYGGGRAGRSARLTPFGAALVDLYRAEMEHGNTIRWDHRVDQAWEASRSVATEQEADERKRRLEMEVLVAKAGGSPRRPEG